MRRFFAEARALARLRHPHIVGVHGIGRMADGRYFLVMDLVEDGTTLAGLLRQGPVPFDRAAGLVATVAEAIEHAHSRGVIHRDLKPSNVLLDAEGRPHVTDFGLAKVFDAADPDNPQTTADRILGTPHYMAPEQADPARGPITPRTDVYALGGLLYALLTGKPPIQGDSLTAILTQARLARAGAHAPRDAAHRRAGGPRADLQDLSREGCGEALSLGRRGRRGASGLAGESRGGGSAGAAADSGRTTGSDADRTRAGRAAAGLRPLVEGRRPEAKSGPMGPRGRLVHRGPAAGIGRPGRLYRPWRLAPAVTMLLPAGKNGTPDRPSRRGSRGTHQLASPTTA